jgi:hypothetical protein
VQIEKIQRVNLREVWRHEAHDFSAWLSDNIDVLNDAVDLNLASVEREQSAGSFSVDLVAEDDQLGGRVVVENQLERSDHDHLGKLITYLTAFDAKAAIWIVGDARPEHTAAIAWLNESADADFYLLKAEAIRIGASPAALLLTRIVGPSEETKRVGGEKRELSEREDLRFAFWRDLLAHAKSRMSLHANVSPHGRPWMGAGAGHAGPSFNYGAKMHGWSVFLYIDRGSDAENNRVFDFLHAQREAIEAQFGGPIEWQRLDDRRACSIASRDGVGGCRDPKETWPDTHERMSETMARFVDSIQPNLALAVRAAESAQDSFGSDG